MTHSFPTRRSSDLRAYVTVIVDQPSTRSPGATLAGMMIADPAIRARWATWIAERLTRHADTDSGIEFELTRLAADGAWHRHLVDGGPGPQLSAIRRRLIEATQPSTAERRGGKECVSTLRSRWSPYH